MSRESWNNLAKAADNGFFAAVCLMLAGMGIALVGMLASCGSMLLEMLKFWEAPDALVVLGLKSIAAGVMVTLSAFFSAFVMAQIGTWALDHKEKKGV